MPATLKKTNGSPPPSTRQEAEPKDLERIRRADRDQARLDYLTRPSRSLELAVRWRRFYQRPEWTRRMLRQEQADLQQTISELRQRVAKPEPHWTGETWTRAALKLEEMQAQVSAIRFHLRSAP